MEDIVLVLVMLFVLVLSSFMLDKYACMILSTSGFALLFGLAVGMILVITGNHKADLKYLNLDDNLFFSVLLPPIIYEAGFSVKREAFFRNFGAIMSTAIIGTIISTVVSGGTLYIAGKYDVVTQMSWVEAFLFGSLISAVDPIGTLACFNKLNAPPLLFNLVFGESVLNDAIVIAVYQTLHKWPPDPDLSLEQVWLVSTHTIGMFVGSLIISATITLFAAYLLNREVFRPLRHFPAYEISLCLIASLLTYFIAEGWKLSGIIALFFSGTMTAHYHFHTISTEAQKSLTHLLHTAAFICETTVYVFMGTSVVMLFATHVDKKAGTSLHIDDLDWKFTGVTLLACIVGRFLNIFPLLGISNAFRSKSDSIPISYMSMIWISGLRGSISFSLAKKWSYIGLHKRSHRKLVESTTLLIVLFTTVVVGGLTGPFLSALGLTGRRKKPKIAQHIKKDLTSLEQESSRSTDDTHTDEINIIEAALARSTAENSPNLRSRSSMHYVVRQVGDNERRQSKGNLRNSISSGTNPINNRKKEFTTMTPRPQFRDYSSDEDDNEMEREIIDEMRNTPSQAERLPNVSTVIRHLENNVLEQSQHVTASNESLMSFILRGWQDFDIAVMQPIFGGYTQVHHRDLDSTSSRAAMNNAM